MEVPKQFQVKQLMRCVDVNKLATFIVFAKIVFRPTNKKRNKLLLKSSVICYLFILKHDIALKHDFKKNKFFI